MAKNYIFLLFVLIYSHSNSQNFDLQGHRGARGLLPENSIPGFIKALDLGVTTLELDVIISGDGKVVVSHEPWFNPEICLDPEGNTIDQAKAKELNLYKMNYLDIKSYDCGSLGNSRFPDQINLSTYKPLLSEVIQKVEDHIQSTTKFKVNYNIEIKSTKSLDEQYQPKPNQFSERVYEVVDEAISWDRVTIQSFDMRILQYLNSNHSDITLALLVENIKGIDSNLEKLGFKPSIYSPHFKLINEKAVNQLHSMGIKLIPWTVNEKKDMVQLKQWGVDGLITDYPDRAVSIGLGIEIPHQEKN